MKKKRLSMMLFLLLAVSLLMFGAARLSLNAEEPKENGYCGDNVTWTYNPDMQKLWIEGTGSMTSYTMDPNSIRAPWTDFREDIRYVEISEGVENIGDYAFSQCTGIEYVTLPSTLTYIGQEAFYNCASLKSLEIPDTVTEIWSWAFAHCTSMTNLKLPNSLEKIPAGLCYNCSSLTDIAIPGSVTEIGNEAFFGCSGLTDIVIPERVTELGDNSYLEQSGIFGYCSSLESVTLPSTLTRIQPRMFEYCTSLESINIPANIWSIEENAFRGCSSLININVADENRYYKSENGVLFDKNLETLIAYPGGRKSGFIAPLNLRIIAKYAFAECKNLTGVSLPAELEFIEEGAFKGCTGLKNIYLYEALEFIGPYAFQDCANLEEVTLEGGNAWDPDSERRIAEGAFYNCPNLKKIYIPFGFTEIEERAFGYQDILGWDDESGEWIIVDEDIPVDGFTITGFEGSAAETYANENDIPFIPITLEEITASNVVLEKDTYTYDKTPIEPDVYVMYGSKTLKKGVDYSVTYKNNINAGTGSVTVKGIGQYSGTVTKYFVINKAAAKITAKDFTKTHSTKAQTFSLGAKTTGGKLSYSSNNSAIKVTSAGKITIKAKYIGKATITITSAENTNYKKTTKKITVTVNPTATALSDVSNVSGRKMKVTWKKNSVGKGYEIQYSTSSKFSKNCKSVKITKNSTVSKTITGLTKGKTYYVRIRTVYGSFYSSWSKAKSVKISK